MRKKVFQNSKMYTCAWEKVYFIGIELTPVGQRGEKYLSNETFSNFLAQKTAAIQCIKVWTSKNIMLKKTHLKFCKLFMWFLSSTSS